MLQVVCADLGYLEDIDWLSAEPIVLCFVTMATLVQMEALRRKRRKVLLQPINGHIKVAEHNAAVCCIDSQAAPSWTCDNNRSLSQPT